MRVALIVNPVATRSGRTLRAEATELLAQHGLAEVLVTRASGEAAALAALAAGSGVDLVVALGGDGTVADAAGALVDGPVALAPIPAGSTNVFARALGWPSSPRRALAALEAALERPHRRTLILGRLEAGEHRRVFCVNAGIGLDAETVHLVEARPALKRALRQGGFALATVAATGRTARHPNRLAVSVDGEGPQWLVSLAAACGRPYAYLGRRPLDLVPGAGFDGTLAWTGLRTARATTVARVVGGALAGGRHIDSPAVAHGVAARSILVRAEHPAPLQADGEALGWHSGVLLAPGPTLATLAPPRLK
ncbi:MAG TPA: diacylglycerol kinase family protein [Miltoncostaeaceae bacterium]|nr:diacylglycerol kinase family protein [Miltoncostaeaceae bacterium]